MTILFLTDNFPPEVNAPANRTHEHCKEWIKKGAKVIVITCAPNFPKGKVFEGYRNKLYAKEIIDGITVIRVWSYISANEGTLKRTLDYFSFCLTSFIAGLFVKSDVIVATSPQFFTALSGRWLAFWKRTKWVMEVRDIWPESIVAVGAMKRNRIILFFEWLEKRLYASANHIVVVTDSFKVNLIQKGVSSDKISVFKNGANLQMYSEQDKDSNLLKELNLDGKFIFAYIGTHGMAHGLDFILRAIENLQTKHPNFHFLFIGDGAERENLISLSKKLKLVNTTFLPSVNKQKVIEYLSIMDVALVNLRKSDTFLNVIPSKIFEAAAMGKPILLGLEGETKGIIENYDAGLCFEPENEEQFLTKSVEIYQNNIYSKKVQGALNLSLAYDRNKIAINMLHKIEEIANGKLI